MKEIRKGLYRIENKKIKQIENNLLKLENSFSKLKKYSDYDAIEYRGIKDVKIYLIYQLMKIIINQ